MQAQAKPGTIRVDALAQTAVRLRAILRRAAPLTLIAVAVLILAGCGGTDSADPPPKAVQGTDSTSPPSDPEPERLDGTESQEFEAEDIEAAENASPQVQEYCSGAVSEAQYEGCLSHVTEDEMP
jgi:hypothetical protein